MRKFLTLAFVAITSLAAAGCSTMGGSDKQKVVYHVNGDDDKQLMATLGNIKNHINAVGKENIDLRVVMHGNGLGLLSKAKSNEDMKAKIDELKLSGVSFNVCKNTLVGKKINYKTDLHDVKEKDIVPSGVAEVAKLQQQGFAYVKP